MKNPKVSVIITAYNYGKYLPECLNSVIKQRFEDWELIIVDDGSTDNTSSILSHYLEKYPERLKVLSQTNSGLAKVSEKHRGNRLIILDSYKMHLVLENDN